MIKKVFIFLGLLLILPTTSHATFNILRDAGSLNRGTLPNERLDSSSVTLMGPLTNGSQILSLSSVTIYGTITSSTGFKGGASTFTAITINGLTQTTIGISSGSQTVDTFHLKNTGVSAGQYGDTFQVPQLTVDEDGRVTSITNKILPTSSTNSITPFNFVLGALTDPNATVSSNTVDGLNEIFRLCGASGLTTSATAQCNVQVRPGLYNHQGATIPAGVTLEFVKGSSVNVSNGASGNAVIYTVYGTVLNGIADMNNVNLLRPVIDLRSNSTVKDFKILNTLERSNKNNVVTIKNSTNVYFSSTFDNYLSSGPTSDGFDDTVVVVDNSTNCYISVKGEERVVYAKKPGTDAISPIVAVLRSSRVRLEDSKIKNGRSLVWLGGGYANSVSNNEIFVSTYVASLAVVLCQLSPGTTAYSHLISNNRFIVSDNITVNGTNVIDVQQPHFGVTIKGNFFRGVGFTRFLAITNNGGAPESTVVKDNDVWGIASFISDTGTDTKYTGLGNFINGVEQ